jgi:hypothetical protein
VLECVENQTPEICLEAVKNNKFAFQFVDDSMVEKFIALLT